MNKVDISHLFIPQALHQWYDNDWRIYDAVESPLNIMFKPLLLALKARGLRHLDEQS